MDCLVKYDVVEGLRASVYNEDGSRETFREMKSERAYMRQEEQLSAKPGNIEEFEVNVGVYQASALSPLLFAIVMKARTQDIS